MCISALLQTHAQMHGQTHAHTNIRLIHTTKWVTLVHTPILSLDVFVTSFQPTYDLFVAFKPRKQ